MTKWPAEPLLEQLCRERYGRLMAMAVMLLGGHDGAEDLVQDALIAVFRKRRSFPNLPSAEAYVRRAIASRFLDGARKSTKEDDAVRRHAVREGVVAAPPADATSVTDAEALLATLPPRVRACVALRFLDDMSVAETARALGLSQGAVKRYVSDGLAALNAAFGTDSQVDEVERALVVPTRRNDV